MNHYQKGFVIPLIITIIAVLAIGGVVYFAPKKQVQAPVIVDTNVPVQNSPVTSKVYTGNKFGFDFTYPVVLSLTEKQSEVVLNHSIPYKNNGCDMKGDGTSYDKLSDFNMTIGLYDKSLVETVKMKASFLTDSNFSAGKLIVSPGFIDTYEIGSLKGYSIYTGAEGCGYTTYYFPISVSKTLVVKKDQVQEFSGAVLSEIKEKVLAMPGVISPEKADQFFRDILLSIKFTTSTIETPVACTMDAMMCPDGSYVGRSGPKCEFVCPEIIKTENIKCISEGGLNYENVLSSTPINQRLKCCPGLIAQEKPGIADAPAVCVKQTVDIGSSVKINQTIIINEIKITPLEVVEDSRCPKDVTCVWAGTVKLKTKIEREGQTEEKVLTLLVTEQPVKLGNVNVLLKEVKPVKISNQVIKASDYIFTFSLTGMAN